MKKTLLIWIGFNIILWAGFSRNGVGIVTDNITKLQWQDDYRDNNRVIKQDNWNNAIDYCEALTLGGFNDWRLPNINELTSIIDFDIFNTIISAKIFNTFVNTRNGNYWSSTNNTGYSSNTWNVDFDNGTTSGDRNINKSFVRCVRAGK